MMTAHRGTVLADDRLRRVAERQLSPIECHAWLSSHHEGRLSYLSGRGSRSVVVLYTLADQGIVMRLPDYHDAAHYAPGAEVRFDVEGVGAASQDAVHVRGRAVLADHALFGAAQDGVIDVQQEESNAATLVVCLPISQIDGYEIELAGQT